MSTEDIVTPNFFQRFGNIPLVQYSYDVYVKAKQYSVLARYTLEFVEVNVAIAIDINRIYNPKFDAQVNFANEYACKVLDILEPRIPLRSIEPYKIQAKVVKFYQERVSEPVSTTYRDSKQYGKDVILCVKNFGIQKKTEFLESRYYHFLLSTLHACLQMLDALIEKCLPPAITEECSDALTEESGIWAKVTNLYLKIRSRLPVFLAIKFEAAKERAEEILPAPITDLLAFLKCQLDPVTACACNVILNLWDFFEAGDPHYRGEKTIGHKLKHLFIETFDLIFIALDVVPIFLVDRYLDYCDTKSNHEVYLLFMKYAKELLVAVKEFAADITSERKSSTRPSAPTCCELVIN